MQYYNEIKNKLIDNEINRRVKNYSIKLICEVNKKYNTNTLKSIR